MEGSLVWSLPGIYNVHVEQGGVPPLDPTSCKNYEDPLTGRGWCMEATKS